MQNRIFNCSIHEKQTISFFCVVNQWHFVPLCNKCIPQHTQNHPKNFKIIMESFQKIRQKSSAQVSYATQQYSKRLKIIQNYLKQQQVPQTVKTIESIRSFILEAVNNCFDDLKNNIQQQLFEIKKSQQDIMMKLQTNVKADMQDLQNLGHIQNISQWSSIIRRLYFKDGISIYLEQIDDMLKDHQGRISKSFSIAQLNKKKLGDQIRNSIKTHVRILEQKKQVVNSESNNKMEEKDKKKAPKIIIKQKICKNCNGQLQYLTNLKKHLFCPNCGSKQRNYNKKN